MVMINAEPLKRYIENVEQAEEAWLAVRTAYGAAAADEKDRYAEEYQLTHQAYFIACAQLASAVTCEVKATERWLRPPTDQGKGD